MLIRTRSYRPTGSLSQTFEDFYFEKEKRGRPPCPSLGVYQVHRAQACDAVLLTGRRGRCAAALEMSARSERDSWSHKYRRQLSTDVQQYRHMTEILHRPSGMGNETDPSHAAVHYKLADAFYIVFSQ